MHEFFSNIKLIAFDLDGTLYVGEKIIPGAVELVSYLRGRYQVVFFTNNSSKTASQIHDILNGLGIECTLEEVYASSSATAVYLREFGIDNLYVVGSPGLNCEIKSNGLNILDADSAENLVVGLDPDFSYKKLANALNVLLKDGKYIVCNEDGSFPSGEKKYLPGCGAIVSAISAAANKKPDFMVGKPNTYMLAKISEKYDVDNSEIIVVGDSYKSDILMALNFSCKAVLVSDYCNDSPINDDRILVVENLQEFIHFMRG